MREKKRVYYSIPSSVKLLGALHLLPFWQVRQRKPIISTLAGLANSISAREIPRWWLAHPARLGCGILCSRNDPLFGGYLYARGQTEEYACNGLWLRLVKDLWTILRQEVRRGRLVAPSEAALRHRIPKTLAFFKTEVLHTLMWSGVSRRAREGSKPIWCYLFHQATGSR